MNPTKIDWPGLKFTWNPVTGCRRGCFYCYAKKIHDRFEKDGVSFSNIEFHPDRLLDKMPKKSTRIFVGSMSDIEYWEREWTERILNICRENKRHTFMFLSKQPRSYYNFNWPANTMQGLTLEKINSIDDNYKITTMIGNFPRPFLSIEPLLGPVLYNKSVTKMELVIVGAMTGPRAKKPLKEWVENLDWIPSSIIHYKQNIKEYL